MTTPTTADEYKPGVMIVGAGLGGLLLATLLERLGYPYHVFERATHPRPLGSAMTLGPNILPVFEQLGLLKEIERISLPCPALQIHKADNSKFGSVKLMGERGTGYENLLFDRPQLHGLLLRQVPPTKISHGKKVLRVEEKDSRVFIHCSDNTSFEGDILVGADGAYSGVRQSLYRRLKESGSLPKADEEEFTLANICMVGIANPQSPESFPQLQDDFCHFSTTLGENMRACTVVSIPNNRVCWSLVHQLSKSEAKAQHFRNSEWGPESNEAMIKEFQDLPCPWGGTMRALIDATPRNLISKVFLEEKVFKTWFHGRTALIGDACHKMLPGAGQGAVNAMQDAVVLANCIYHMPDTRSVSITAAFEEYYRQRYHHAIQKFGTSKEWSMVMFGQTWSARLARQIMVNTPEWLFMRTHSKNFAYRPQIAWLPLIEKRGFLPVLPQEGPQTQTTPVYKKPKT